MDKRMGGRYVDWIVMNTARRRALVQGRGREAVWSLVQGRGAGCPARGSVGDEVKGCVHIREAAYGELEDIEVIGWKDG